MRYTMLARYGAMRTIGTFSANIRKLRLGDRCILRSNRGTEWGEIISEPDRVDGPAGVKTDGTVIRRVTPKDYERRKQIEEVEQAKEYAFCADKIKERQLPMRLASVEHIFGGEKIIFYFLADGRVDFRELVKDLAAEYRTRIELRQIGVRDEARLLAEYEHCGRELCCRTFIKDLQPVTMRMAKLQKTTLDPSKISGRCGRLMCCLRYEDETYAELKRNLPKKGTRVRISEGVGEVVSAEILAQAVCVELPDRRTLKVQRDEILEVLPEEKPQRARRGRRDNGPGPADRPSQHGRSPKEPTDRSRKPRERPGTRAGAKPARGDARDQETRQRRPANQRNTPSRRRGKPGERRGPRRGARPSDQKPPRDRTTPQAENERNGAGQKPAVAAGGPQPPRQDPRRPQKPPQKAGKADDEWVPDEWWENTDSQEN